MASGTSELEKNLFRLLEEDEEFRCAVAAKIGLLKILKKLDEHIGNSMKCWRNCVSIMRSSKNMTGNLTRSLKSLNGTKRKLNVYG